MKTFNDFILEAAFKYGCELSAITKPTVQFQVLVDAAEQYAEYRFIQGKGDMVLGHVAMDLEKARTNGWNEALKWAVNHPNRQFIGSFTIVIDKDSILKGLK